MVDVLVPLMTSEALLTQYAQEAREDRAVLYAVRLRVLQYHGIDHVHGIRTGRGSYEYSPSNQQKHEGKKCLVYYGCVSIYKFVLRSSVCSSMDTNGDMHTESFVAICPA
jgi:hypothetical protein